MDNIHPIKTIQQILDNGEAVSSIEDAPIVWHTPSIHKDFNIEVGELNGEYKAFAQTKYLDKIINFETPFCQDFRTTIQLIYSYIELFRAGGRRIN